eukprot:scaffold5773_cov322-Prasinococcus_capsulatus_cf.AAC.1
MRSCSALSRAAPVSESARPWPRCQVSARRRRGAQNTTAATRRTCGAVVGTDALARPGLRGGGCEERSSN